MIHGRRSSENWATAGFNLWGTNFTPFNQDHLFWVSSANGGDGRWYMARQGDGANYDWHLYQWDGLTKVGMPNEDTSWEPVSQGLVNNPVTSSSSEMLGQKETHRLLLKWDDTNNILHIGQIHMGRPTNDGCHYANYTFDPSNDNWTGGGAPKLVVHSNFVNIHDNVDPDSSSNGADMTSDTNWPNQAERLSMALEPAHSTTTTWPRVWISFMYSDGTNIDVYANCSTSEDYQTWEENAGSSSIANYMKLVDDNGFDVKAGGGTDQEMLHNDSQAKLYSGKTSGTPYIGLFYNNGSDNKWYTIERSVAAAPTAGGGEGFGSPAAVVTESDGLSHQMNVNTYFATGQNTSTVVFASTTAKHNIRYGVRLDGSWSTSHFVDGTNRGYPNIMGDPTNNNLFLFCADHGVGTINDDVVLDYGNSAHAGNPCSTIQMKVVNAENLSIDIAAWQQVLTVGTANTDYITPMPVISRSTPFDNAGGGGAAPWFNNSKLLVMSTMIAPGSANLWEYDSLDSGVRNLSVLWNEIDPVNYEVTTGNDTITSITLQSPNVGQVVTVGEELTITWDTN